MIVRRIAEPHATEVHAFDRDGVIVGRLWCTGGDWRVESYRAKFVKHFLCPALVDAKGLLKQHGAVSFVVVAGPR